jgi:hypothetical protein
MAKIIKGIGGFMVVLALIAVTSVGMYNQAIHGNILGDISKDTVVGGDPLRLCKVTQTVVAIGNQASTKILNAGARQWAIIQQPANATNTVALSLSQASSTIATGYKLNSGTTTEFRLGFATDIPTPNFVEAITSAGSTTITVLECK